MALIFEDNVDESQDIQSLQAKEALTNKQLDDERDKRRSDQVSTAQWATAMIIALIAITFVAMGNLVTQLNKFNAELREVRDRITTIETERRIERDRDTD